MARPEVIHTYTTAKQSRPCCYCNKAWIEKSASYRQVIGLDDYLQRIGQLNGATKKTTWVWICKACLEKLKQQIQDMPAREYMTTDEEIASATIVLKEEQQEEVVAT